ncbi:hypothetical protein [Helicobacter sp. MIT 05-5294]|uniref:structural cement protein Gp24 n=1 Tax=Helicobacter sp. MIT 05-5294 TaxID=1548150 RepID=UPI00051FD37D|nr:hypothetical protein [Helicobacter sp. MIT 05-5294]TLD85798.1 hypothetical protein LS69_007840 [Helicobacter sp. MIT 05-5294]
MFQDEVRATQALGVAGEPSKAIHSYYNTFAGLASDDNVKFGGFVFSSTDANAKEFEAVGANGGNILGICIKDRAFYGNGVSAAVPKGMPITICNAGNVYIETEKVAKRGQSVEVDTTTGEVTFADAAGANASGWYVVVGNATAAKGVIEISTAKL